MKKVSLFALLLPLVCACSHVATVRRFPRFSESQNEWLQSHCRVVFVDEVEGDARLDVTKARLAADVVERLAASESVVQLMAYRCAEPVPPEVARGEE